MPGSKEDFQEPTKNPEQTLIYLQNGSLVQVVSLNHNLFACVLIVTKLTDWGIQADLILPNKKIARTNLKFDEIIYVGDARVINQQNEENKNDRKK